MALEHLAHPSLQPESADEIITVLVRHAEDHDYSLALAYYHSVKPVLKTPEALELLFGAVAHTSVTQAFSLSRTYPDAARQALFLQLVSSVLGGPGNQDVASRASDLVSLPLDSSEEAWLQDYLTVGEGRKLKGAKDTVMMRKVATGRPVDSLRERNLGPQWNVVLQALQRGVGGRTDV